LEYKNLQCNFIGSGGQEIDVSADYRLPALPQAQIKRTVCECKAYRAPVDMPDWLKFLGKVYAEQFRLGHEVQGVFIALNGVNGNVHGNYDELQKHGCTATIVTGEHLGTLLMSIFNLPSTEKLLKTVAKLTLRQHVGIEMAYHSERVYWVFTFENDAFAVLDATGRILSQEEHKKISDMVKTRLSATTCIDLSAEAEAKQRATQVQKFVLGMTFAQGGRCSLNQLDPNTFGYSEGELRSAMEATEVPFPGDIGLATSSDGIHWIKNASNTPLLIHQTVGFESGNIGTPSLYKEKDTWYVYYHGYDGTDCHIGVATGTSLTNLTRYQENPIIKTGEFGQWDAGGIGKRYIRKEGRYYYMIFEGSTDHPFDTAKWSTGIARSTDLLNWTKFSRNLIIPRTSGGFGYDAPEFVQTPDTNLFIYYRSPAGPTDRSQLVPK
jgi:hypothetical protein